MPEPKVATNLTLGNKLARGLWTLAWLLLYRPTPRNLHWFRRGLLRVFGADIGKQAHPYPAAKIYAPWNLVMGEHSCISDYVDCYCVARVELKPYALVSQYSYLCTATHDYNDPLFPTLAAPITIGENAWVAADVFVAPGVTIGARAVVGARSTIRQDVSPGDIVAGNPARVIGKRDE